MTLHFNASYQKQRRRFLRSHLSKAEAVLWTHLSRRQLLGYKFRRQYSVDQYIVDLYCPELKLAIEVDGPSHFTEEAKEYDSRRQAYIEAFGIRFLRVTNVDVLDNLHGVLDEIAAEIGKITRS
jgi:very-short-patch-repair endonuclease